MTGNIIKIAIGVFAFVIGFVMYKKAIKRSKLIDTESLAVVKAVKDLGRLEGRRVYAIQYRINSHDPFDLIVSPCKKPPQIGTQRSIFYEKQNPKQNYYFKSISQFDNRLLWPCVLTACGVLMTILNLYITIASLFV